MARDNMTGGRRARQTALLFLLRVKCHILDRGVNAFHSILLVFQSVVSQS